MCDITANVANCKRQSMSLLLLRNYERHPLWPAGTFVTPRKHQEGLVLHQNSLGQTAELCLRCPVQTDLARSPSVAGTHKPNMAGRQEKKNSPLCWVNPKCPIGLKWFQLVVLGLRLWGEDFQLPRHLIAYVLYGMERMQMPPAIQTLHHNGPSITSTQRVN